MHSAAARFRPDLLALVHQRHGELLLKNLCELAHCFADRGHQRLVGPRAQRRRRAEDNRPRARQRPHAAARHARLAAHPPRHPGPTPAVDANRDGTPDYVVFNLENGGFAATGQNVVAIANLATNATTIFFFTDADLDSSNVILTAPLSALGLSPSSRFDFSVFAFDN